MTDEVYAPIVRALQERRFGAAERTAIRLVKQEPLNPQGWVFLAEALMQQGFIQTASKAFDRAWLLDPEAEWVESVYALLAVLKDRGPRFDIEALLSLPTVTVTAVIITEDDGPTLKRCLASLDQAVDEVIIVDRASTAAARTIEDTAGSFPQMKVQYMDYRGEADLASAKNRSLQLVTSEWVIFVQGNEYLFRQDQFAIQHISSLYSRVDPPVILSVGLELIHPHEHSPITYEEARMFPMGHGFRFWGKEQPRMGDQRGSFTDNMIQRQRPVRIRLGVSMTEQQQMRRLLAAAKENLLKSKERFATYRGLATADRQILTWKADKLLSEIAKYSEGDSQ